MRQSETNSRQIGRITATSKAASKAPPKAYLGLFLAGFLAACGTPTVENDYPETYEGATQETGSLFDSFTLGWGSNSNAEAAENADNTNADASTDASTDAMAATKLRGLGVNSYLWRAALDTISFMPMASSDPIGGVIITDWYNNPNVPNERVKINVVITGLELRGDALDVALFREKLINGRWSSVEGSKAAGRQLENIVLTRARDFKIAAVAAKK
jgi:hypothetical protein